MTVIKDIEEHEKLKLEMQKKLQMDLILQSLTSLCSQFIINLYMNKLDCTIPELVNMLVATEGTLKSSKGTILAMEQTSFKRKSTRKKKIKSVKKEKKKNKPRKEVPKKVKAKEKYFHCDAEGYRRRNYPLYLESLKMKEDE